MKINVTRPSMPPFEEFCKEIKPLWETRWLTNYGDIHNKFEDSVKKYLEVKNVSLFVNGHAALEAAISVFNFKTGSEIITTPFTFVSTVNAIVRNGLKPVFCDIDKYDFTIDETRIEQLITKKTVAILGVHVYGNICHIEAIDKIAKKYNLKVIYDAAHAFGIKYKGIGIGNFGDISMFSFHATKVFNSIEGGCLTYGVSSFHDLLYAGNDFGLVNGGERCISIGNNAKMNEFQAAMGFCNLKYVDDNIISRKRVVDLYKSRLHGIPGIYICDNQDGVASNYSYFPIIFINYKYTRDQIKQKLEENDIGSRKYFYPLISNFECYKHFKHGDTKNADFLSERVLSLPLYPELSDDEVNLICDIILN